MDEKPIRIAIASGGTGGHVYPCLAVAEAIRQMVPDAKFLFIGARGKIDEQIILDHGFEFDVIDISGFPRGRSCSALRGKFLTAFRLATLRPLSQAMRSLRRFRPHVIFGAGGYVSGPVIAAGWIMRIPRAILEANAVPGLANKLIWRLSNVVYIGLEPATKFFRSGADVIVTGNPLRPGSRETGLKLMGELGLEKDKLLILAAGGSLGSELINRTVAEMLQMLSDNKDLSSRIQILHCVGKRFHDAYIEEHAALIDNLSFRYIALPFIAELNSLYYVADIAICRGGAITLSELAAAGPAAIIVPWEGAANNEQLANARSFEENGAAMVIEEKDLDGQTLYAMLMKLVTDDARRAQLRARCALLARPDAARTIASYLISLGCRR
ncbi:MAG: UDP-N-acetylglucosamine--N-acetylmuramyl-(pentapeptide) pyrophosphoryl-undecaprenol N-acetylglucosamine transferase [Candidatus Coatesbacteria bacterium]|nr:UDP-N-acetylglucosamine--N-acetylmuramyl-(pentapeptide) pyrophosphoryl-undecaprenol N-acetylglucosamine transferase [Candidatus Coatesbacteria bacterium]